MQETLLGHGNSIGFSEVHRTQSAQHLDKSLVSEVIICHKKFMTLLYFQGTEYNLGQPSPTDRVKLALERLIQGKNNNYKMQVWKKGSFTIIHQMRSQKPTILPV